MTDNRFRRQFLFTKQTTFDLAWNRLMFQEFTLFYHPELELTVSKSQEKEIVMMGMMYDWVTPAQTNQQLLDKLAHTLSFEDFLTGLSRYAGQYVILYRDDSHFVILHDVCGQSEIYYDASFSTFGSQPKLMGEVMDQEPHHDREALEFYASREFLSRKNFVGDTTHVGNIKHLLPNHYIDVNQKKVVRYFPTVPIKRLSAKEVAPKACKMLKGYIKAVALREKIAMAVTAGYDSRVLFLASLDEECRYFVCQHKNMSAKHHDITIPQRLTKMYGKAFEVIPDKELNEDIYESIDFPRTIPQSGKYFDGYIYFTGNSSEIARNVYGYHDKLTPEDLAFFGGYNGSRFVAGIYRQWLENATLFQTNGYDILDMFFWEQRVGTRIAKEKTMMNAIGKDYFSPYCSRDLFVLLLSTPRKDRDYNVNKLYYSILLELSPNALKLPINPCFKLDLIRLTTKLKLYNLYRDLGLKYRFLKF